MPRKLLALVIVGLVVVMVFPAGVAAGLAPSSMPQAGDAIVIHKDGDLWVWTETGGLSSLTQDAHVSGARMSPDGTRMAYLASSPLTIAAVERVGGIGGGPLPADIHIVDIHTGNDIPVAVQPPDASFFVEGVPDSAWLRSMPAWSPDGTQLAWAEVHYPSFAPDTNRLMVYDLATNTAQTLVTNLPDRAYIPGPQDVIWGGGGLAVLAVTWSETRADGYFFNVVQVYDLNGGLVSELYMPDDNPDVPRPDDYVWITQEGRDYVGLLYPDGTWELFDPLTGSRVPPAGMPELYSRTAPDNALALTFSIDPNAEEYGQNHIWTVIVPDGPPAQLSYRGYDAGLSPSGHAVIYPHPENGVSIWYNGQVNTIGMDGKVSRVFWGPLAWRVGTSQPGVIPPPPSPAPPPMTCPGSLPSRLVVGGQGQVIPNTSPNNIRDQATTGGNSVGQIPPGGVFSVLDGPQCADGFAWWQVNYQGTIGWTAEGDSNAYWVEPVE